jgi:hypothetical protein
VNLERIGAELFGWLILLAAAVMAADWIVANRFYAPREPAGGSPGPAEVFAETVAGEPPAGTGPPPIPPPVPAPAAGPPPVPPPVPVSGAGV